MGLSFLAEGRSSVGMGVFQARTDIFQEFGPKRLFWERTEWGLLGIWLGGSAFVSSGEDRLWMMLFTNSIRVSRLQPDCPCATSSAFQVHNVVLIQEIS